MRTLFRSVGNCIEPDCREVISAAALKHAMAAGDAPLCLYDVTTLYFETEKEDELVRSVTAKERRGPVILLVAFRHLSPGIH